MNRRPPLTISILALLAVGGLAWPARADVFLLRSGGRVEGTLANPDELPRQTYVIDTADGARLTFERGQIARVVRRTAAQEDYLASAAGFADSSDGQWQLAQWCKDHHLATERRVHLQRVIELDPNHAEARRALGYSLIDGRWWTQAELMTSRGYVRHRGRWVLPQEVELSEQRRKDELAEKEWRVRIKRWTGWLDDPEKTGEAQRLIGEINDPYALPALADWLAADPVEARRRLALDTVAAISDPFVVDVLVQVSLTDPEPELRRTALEQIVRQNAPRAVELYVRQLKSKENQTVNDAAVALAYLGDNGAIGPLIDSLYTSHKFVLQPPNPGQNTASFVNPNSTGGSTTVPNANLFGQNPGGLTMGGGPKIITQRIPNRDVLEALIALTRQNFEFDLKAWRSWYASQKKSQSLDARRDAGEDPAP